jgi:hypothetical protein
MIPPYLPMLATAAQPFDSDEYVFEVKWDGVRALAEASPERWRLWGRGLADYTDRYPELAVLRRLPGGAVAATGTSGANRNKAKQHGKYLVIVGSLSLPPPSEPVDSCLTVTLPSLPGRPSDRAESSRLPECD